MSSWQGAQAIVTGAASGIGLALSEELLRRGVSVCLTDINVGAVKQAAEDLGAGATSCELDVRDAAAFRELVDRVAAEHGRVDFLFNNAGIGIAGESHEIGVEHYDRIIDINIRGVTNGIAAAYPGMVAARRGHIVNTASAAGLLPVPLMASYAMTKHAVVGLSQSLRFEAERYGVRVSALCPTAIETPLLDSEGPGDLSRPWRPDLRAFLTTVGGAPYPVADFARYALDRIERNQGLIVAPTSARIATLAYRLLPGLTTGRMRKSVAAELAKRAATERV